MAKGKFKKWLEPDGLLLLEAWARDGSTDKQLADKMGISESTLYDWKSKYPEISESLKRGKDVIDVQIENALIKRALGYSYTEDKYACVEMDQDEYYQAQRAYINKYKYEHPEASQGEIDIAAARFPKTKSVLVERKTKEVIPDTTAQIFWLTNRRNDKWKRNSDPNTIQSFNTEKQNMKALTIEELKAIANTVSNNDK